MKNDLEILYEDNHIIVVFKKINVLSQGDNTNDIDMLTIIKKYIKEKYQKPGNVYLGLVHRLDRPTSGIMVFAKTSKAASRLFKEIENKEFKKSYLAVVQGYLEDKEGILEDYIKKDDNNNSIISTKENGKYAKLEYKVLSFKNNLSLVKINLITGRHHQIRIQFKSRNHPLYGDQRYGKKDQNQLALCAYKLSFIHPVTKERLNFVRYPDYGIFKEFNLENL